VYTLGEILKMIPGSELENRVMVDNLLQREVVQIKGQQNDDTEAGQVEG
jgi:hypothetical protein